MKGHRARISLRSLHPELAYAHLVDDDKTEQFTTLAPTSKDNVVVSEKSVHTSVSASDAVVVRCSDPEQVSENIFQHVSRSGWRQGVIFAAIAATFAFCINIIFTIIVVTKYEIEDGVGTVYTGDCAVVNRWDTAVHVSINILSTCLLAASNFTMQCLNSPTRTEVDAAHAKKRSLDIGVSSFKNLFYLARTKAVLWTGLALSTVPLHLLWNSAVFTTLGAHEISFFVTDESFLSSSSFQEPSFNQTCMEASRVPSITSMHQAYLQGNYSQPMTPAECVKAYGAPFMTDRRNMIAVTRPEIGTPLSPTCIFSHNGSTSTWNDSSVLAVSYEGTNMLIGSNPESFAWLCAGYDDWVEYEDYCDGDKALTELGKNGSWYLRPREVMMTMTRSRNTYKIEYCLSEVAVAQTCQFQFLPSILYTVIVCNVVKVTCMILTVYLFWDLREPLLATIGDAVTSFMQHPDIETRGWCLLHRRQLKHWKAQKREHPLQATIFSAQNTKKLFSATSRTRWFGTVSCCLSYLIFGIVMLHLSLQQPLLAMSFSQIMKLGLGTLDGRTVLNRGTSDNTDLISNALIANSFQAALSMTYFMYNSLYTAQCGALEWAAFANGKRKSLRVSHPKGEQKSTLWLQLPYRYSLPLIIMSALMHFLISQSIFVAVVRWYQQDGSLDPAQHLAAICVSPVAILVTLCVGATLILAQIIHSLRPLRSNIPIHGNSSVIISAMCHPNYEHDKPKHEAVDLQAALSPVTWGATLQPEREGEIGHCTFVERTVDLPTPGKRYR